MTVAQIKGARKRMRNDPRYKKKRAVAKEQILAKGGKPPGSKKK